MAVDTLQDAARFRFARDDGFHLDGSFPNIESQVCFAVIFIRAMAGKAVVTEDGPNIAIVA
jgi:hypothetical protein